jgi:hypothetical protein
MGIKIKSLASSIALGSALLAGPATSTAKADHFVHGNVHGKAVVQHSFAPVRHHAYVRPFHRFAPRASFAYPYPRPYRLVRVLVYDPFPRWVYRRVYTRPYYSGAYCPY